MVFHKGNVGNVPKSDIELTEAQQQFYNRTKALNDALAFSIAVNEKCGEGNILETILPDENTTHESTSVLMLFVCIS